MGRVKALSAVLAAVCAVLLAVPSPASAESLFRHSCLLASEAPHSFAQARASNQWQCQPTFTQALTRHSWLKLDPSAMPQGRFTLVTAAAPLWRMQIVAVDRGGAIHRNSLTGAALSAHWMPGNGLALPVPMPGRAIARLYVGIDGNRSYLPATEVAYETQANATAKRLTQSVLYALALAVLLTVALFSAFMGVATRNRTVALHAVFTGLAAIYTASSSSLIFLVFPALSLWGRAALSYASLSIAISLLGPIMLSFFERRVFAPRQRRLMLVCAGIAALGSLTLPLALVVDYNARLVYHLLYGPGILVLVWGVIHASRERSVAVHSFLLAWVAPLLLGFERVLRGAGLYYLPSSIDALFFIALAVQAMMMAGAIAMQAEAVRRQLDQANLKARAMEDEALTDDLTGLPNRRDFNQRVWRHTDVLAIIDLDRFKPINDRWGHEVGDEVLRVIGRTLARSVASGQVLRAWRLGGEEFAVALGGPSIDRAAMVLNIVRKRLSAEIRTAVAQLDSPVTASAGLAMIGEDGMRQAFRAADAALYRAKAGGRDRLSYESADHSFATIFPRRDEAPYGQLSRLRKSS